MHIPFSKLILTIFGDKKTWYYTVVIYRVLYIMTSCFFFSDCPTGASAANGSMRIGGGDAIVTPRPAQESPTSHKFPVGQFHKP
jgi:hypothetical protein